MLLSSISLSSPPWLHYLRWTYPMLIFVASVLASLGHVFRAVFYFSISLRSTIFSTSLFGTYTEFSLITIRSTVALQLFQAIRMFRNSLVMCLISPGGNRGLNLDRRTNVRPIELSIILPRERKSKGPLSPEPQADSGRHQKASKSKSSLAPKTTEMKGGTTTWLSHT